jgi:hypothetical protein
MKLIRALCLSALYAALRTNAAPLAPRSALSTVTIRTISPISTHYITSNQSPSAPASQHLTVIVGQTLSLDADPLRLQGVEITHISAGETLGILPQAVVEDDGHIVCTAEGADRRSIVRFTVGQKGVLIDGGRVVGIARVGCVYEKGM